LQRVASLLFPAAGLGGTQTGNAQGNAATKSSGFNLGSLLGKFPGSGS
jgi:hypothetical protein